MIFWTICTLIGLMFIGPILGAFEGKLQCINIPAAVCSTAMNLVQESRSTYSITCSNCGFYAIDNKTFYYPKWQLEEIHLLHQQESKVTIQARSFSSHSYLKDLRLIDLRLTALPYFLLEGTQLRTLYITDNVLLTTLARDTFAGQSKLRTLHLERNNLNSINELGFTHLVSLETVQLQQNNITYIPEGVFAGLGRLEAIDLSHNPVFGVTVQELVSVSPVLRSVAVEQWPCATLEKMLEYVRDFERGGVIAETHRRLFGMQAEAKKKNFEWWLWDVEGILCFRQPELMILRTYVGDEDTKERLCTRLVDDQVLSLRDRFNEANVMWVKLAIQRSGAAEIKGLLGKVKGNVKECRELSITLNEVILT